MRDDGDPESVYWQWAHKGWSDHRPHRYPMWKGAIPRYAFWDGRKLGYVEARRIIYAPLYAKAVRKTEAYKRLQRSYKEHKRLILIDYDAYDHIGMDMSLSDVLRNPDRKMGHAFVLAMLLQKDPALDLLGW